MQAQSINVKKSAAVFGLSFLSGAAWGAHEKTAHHWPEFKRRFPRANPGFWNPQLSWKNKYIGGDPANGRSRQPVFFTDAKHLLASTNQVTIFAAGCTVFIGRKQKPWQYAAQIGLSFAGYYLGNRLTFDWIY